MKKALILHGTDGSSEGAWFPWLKQQLEEKGYEVWVPNLPGNHTPNRTVYNDFLFGSDWNFENDIVIGHSSGAVSVLNLLMDERCPRIKAAVMVGAWSHGLPNRYEEGNQQFVNLFPENGFDFGIITAKAGKFFFLHGDDDPYCPLEQAQWLAGKTHGEIMVIPKGGHLGGLRTPEFPELWQLLEEKVGL